MMQSSELFLQHLQGNVCMVLTSIDATINLDNLAMLADKILEVATPSISVMA